MKVPIKNGMREASIDLLGETDKRRSGVSLPFLAAVAILLASCDQPPTLDKQLENRIALLDLPANQWIKYYESDEGGWWRKGHAGLAYDSKRGRLLVFGSDTHGEDWDNRVHEFIPVERRWIHHGVDAPQDSYRIDGNGLPVSGENNVTPWSMHTYDGVEYDPVTDSILVAASPQHNPIGGKVKGAKASPVWRYDLQTREWEPIQTGLSKKGGFFGAATAFDTHRGSLMICGGSLWELPAGKQSIVKNGPYLGCLHRTMAYDSVRRDLYVFGAYKPSTRVWRLQRDLIDDKPQKWEELAPKGDSVPPYTTPPVAFDQENGVFLLIADNPGAKSEGASTFVYHPAENLYRKMPEAVLPKVGMNFMMAWDQIHNVFFLVTGKWDTPTTVWALKLDLSQLR